MPNTIDTLGDRELTKRFLERTLTQLEDSTITRVPNAAFEYLSSIESINLSSAIDVGINAFQYNENLRSVNLPLVTNVGGSAFYSCTSLTSISLPSATSIGNGAFTSCLNLASVNLPLVTVLDGTFNGCKKLVSTSFPSVTTISGYAFQSCSALKTVEFPVLTTISGAYVFYLCSVLQSVIIRNASSVVTLGSTLKTSTSVIFYVPDALVNSYKSATNWSALASRIKGLSELPS